MDAQLIREALEAVGDLLSEQGVEEGIVVVGGAAMALRGFSSRTTGDVDIIPNPNDDVGVTMSRRRLLIRRSDDKSFTASSLRLFSAGKANRLWHRTRTRSFGFSIIARVEKPGTDLSTLTRGEPLPVRVSAAAAQVAQDFNLPNDWLNAVIAHQWDQGLPPSIEDDVEWRTFSNLYVGLAGRQTMISLKLFAAVDQDIHSVHVQDLIQL